MKKNLLFWAFCFLFIVGASAASSNVAAQDNDQIAGGYGTASTGARDVRSAAAFAVRTRSRQTQRNITLVRIQKAEIQIVAGRNYRLCMRVRDNGRLRTVTAVVYRNLRDRRSLSRWRSGGCSEL